MKVRLLTLLTICGILLNIPVVIAEESADELVNKAWSLWNRNDQQAVETAFKEALEVDSKNTRAHLGLAFLYELQEKSLQSWLSYREVFETEDNYFPYVLAAWASNRLQSNRFNPDAGVERLFKTLSEEGDEHGMLRAMAHSMLAYQYQFSEDLDDMKEAFNKINAVESWKLIGPFDNISGSGHSKVFPPEQTFAPGARYTGKNGMPVQWMEIPVVRFDKWIDFQLYFNHPGSVYYANTFVYSPRKQSIYFRLGTSGSTKAFLNDELIIEDLEETNNDLDTYVAETELQQGWNRVLIKVGYSELERCNFLLRLTDARGYPLEGLQYSTDVQSYVPRPDAKVTPVPNFAVEYFRKQVELHPNRVENHVLLAACYMRSEKSIEAELILRQALEQYPNCAYLVLKIVEAYAESEKYDEVLTLLEKMYELDKTIPPIISYKIQRSLDNEDYDEAVQLIESYRQILPESDGYYNHLSSLYNARGEYEKAREIVRKAYKKFPTDYGWVSAMANLVSQSTRDYDAAIEVYENYVEERYSEGPLMQIAMLQLRQGNLKDWKKTMDKVLELAPENPLYYMSMARVYSTLERYDDALTYLNKALEINPTSSNSIVFLASLHRMQGNTNKARETYKKALMYSPTNYTAREHLRELENKPSIFSNFEGVNIDSIIANAPDKSEYPDDNAVFLLEDTKRVVYEKGASEYMTEMVIKVFNQSGVDDIKEYYIGYYSYSEELNIEKAVVRKPDGSEIKGDIDENYIVFKQLEPGDCVYMKWRVKNYYSGKLSEHFWDTYYFNGRYPVKNIRYSLLVPEGYKFHYKAQNMAQEPKKGRVEDGEIYTWASSDEKGLHYEYSMPGLEDIGKILYISTIDSWDFFIEWYQDLAKTKARSTYEIKEKVQELIAGKGLLSEREKIELVYNYITENIRYSSVSFRQSGLIPQKARDVLVSKIGDCKDVSTLAIAMLEELGLQAHYVLVNTRNEGLNKDVLPSIAWNHCITAVETSEGLMYLDLTANNFPLGAMPEMNIGGFCMLIKDGELKPFYMPRDNFMARNFIRSGVVEVRENNSVFISKNTTRTGNLAAGMRFNYRDKGQSDREKEMMEGLASEYPNVKLHKFNIDNLDKLTPEVHYVYEYEVPNFVNEAGSYKFLKLPWADNLEADEALSYEQRAYNYNYWPYADTLVEKLEVKLPPGYEPVELQNEISYSSPIAEYRLSFSYNAGVLTGKRSFVNKRSVVTTEEYLEFKKFYNDVVKEDAKQILLSKTKQKRN